MNAGQCVGRIGALAVAMGVGIALSPATAVADPPGDSGTETATAHPTDARHAGSTAAARRPLREASSGDALRGRTPPDPALAVRGGNVASIPQKRIPAEPNAAGAGGAAAVPAQNSRDAATAPGAVAVETVDDVGITTPAVSVAATASMTPLAVDVTDALASTAVADTTARAAAPTMAVAVAAPVSDVIDSSEEAGRLGTGPIAPLETSLAFTVLAWFRKEFETATSLGGAGLDTLGDPQPTTSLILRDSATPAPAAASSAAQSPAAAANPGPAASAVGDFFGGVGDFLGGIGTAVSDTVQAVVRTVQTAVTAVVNWVQDVAESAITIGRNIVELGVAWLTGASTWLAQLLGIGGSITSSELTPTAALYSILRDLTAVDNSNNFFLEPVLGADGTERLVVFLGGTEVGNGSIGTSTGAWTNLPSWNGDVKDYQKNQILELLNGDQDQPIMLVGYSQGGMDAQNLAAYLKGEGYNVEAVVAFASPVVRTPSADYQTIFLKDPRDPVAALAQQNVSVPDGNLFTGYASTVQGPGFFDIHSPVETYVEIGKQFDAAPGYAAVKEIINRFTNGTAQVRIVLTWGSTPSDLDSHLTGPASPTNPDDRFHISYSYKTFDLDGGTKAASLDLDDTSSYGPEVTTIRVKTPGDYYFYVDNYSRNSETGLAQSGATVAVYTGTSAKVFTVDGTSSGRYWSVFKLTVKANGDVTITPLDVYGDTPIDGPLANSF